jgi:hypothetical protein
MSIRAYKLTVILLLGFSFFLAWHCWGLFRQLVWADYIEKECMITQNIVKQSPDSFGMKPLVQRLEFFINYYDVHGKSLVGSRIEWIVRRDYQQSLTNAVALFRSKSTNDLGSDPQAWIRHYGR